MNKNREALDALEQSTKLRPTDPRISHNKGIIFDRLGLLTDAASSFRKLANLQSSDSHALYDYGLSLAKIKKLKRALNIFEKVVRLDPGNSPWLCLGLTARDLRRDGQALVAFLQVTKLNPRTADAWDEMGLALMRMNRNKEALDAIQKATRLNPKSSLVWHNIGLILEKLGRYREALRAYESGQN